MCHELIDRDATPEADAAVPFQFGGYSVDVDRRELRRGAELIDIGPQGFDLLVYLIHNRNRVVSKDDLLDAVWEGRIVSESTSPAASMRSGVQSATPVPTRP